MKRRRTSRDKKDQYCSASSLTDGPVTIAARAPTAENSNRQKVDIFTIRQCSVVLA
jgi:hypothetical protein